MYFIYNATERDLTRTLTSETPEGTLVTRETIYDRDIFIWSTVSDNEYTANTDLSSKYTVSTLAQFSQKSECWLTLHLHNVSGSDETYFNVGSFKKKQGKLGNRRTAGKLNEVR